MQLNFFIPISRIETQTSTEKDVFDVLEGNIFYLSLYLYFTGIYFYYKTWNIKRYWHGKYEVDDTSVVFKPEVVNYIIFG